MMRQAIDCGHMMRSAPARRWDTYTPSELTPYHALTNAAVRVDGDWWILTPSGLQCYEEQRWLLMSRTE